MKSKPPLRDQKKAAIAKLALKLGYKQHDIAAYFHDNQGALDKALQRIVKPKGRGPKPPAKDKRQAKGGKSAGK